MAPASFSVILAAIIALYSCANDFSSPLVHIGIYMFFVRSFLLLPHVRASLCIVMPNIAVDYHSAVFPTTLTIIDEPNS
jgi:hypothetical protein